MIIETSREYFSISIFGQKYQASLNNVLVLRTNLCDSGARFFQKLHTQKSKILHVFPPKFLEKYFSGQSAGRTSAGTGWVRISSQGLFSSCSKLARRKYRSPENIASSRLVAPGSPRMKKPLR